MDDATIRLNALSLAVQIGRDLPPDEVLALAKKIADFIAKGASV